MGYFCTQCTEDCWFGGIGCMAMSCFPMWYTGSRCILHWNSIIIRIAVVFIVVVSYEALKVWAVVVLVTLGRGIILWVTGGSGDTTGWPWVTRVCKGCQWGVCLSRVSIHPWNHHGWVVYSVEVGQTVAFIIFLI